MNLRDFLLKRLPSNRLDLLVQIGEIADQSGMTAFLVGGAVRDLLLNRGNLDMDIVAEGDAYILAKRVQAVRGGEVLQHSRFGTAKYSLGTLAVDIATSRTEIYYKPGVLPTVRPAPIQEDLARRDFSINAMAISLQPKSLGELLDPFSGEKDLATKVLRVLHEKSFIDDATRILRGIRYEQRLGFAFDSNTEALVRRDASMLDTISGDRVRHEIERWLAEDCVTNILDRAQGLGALQAIPPGFPWNPTLREQFANAQEETQGIPDPRVYLAILACSITQEACAGLMGRLSMAGDWRKVIEDIHKLKERLSQLRKASISPSRIYRILQGLNTFSLEGFLITSNEPQVKDRVRQYITELIHVNPRLNGRDLQKLGVPQGAFLGEVMRRLLEMRLDRKTHSASDEEALVRQWLTEGGATLQGTANKESPQGGSSHG